ncbi:hypothetical protein RN001_015453 [Aquatica leii]|uniref:Uncharacterized protein n=1 Tax=Aquatica leii TaxID=1421715 RepID=A0AAN7PPQ2_9COLE|nr:hypothetical protein RN001_015453 [Aquatica leii]
MKLTNSTRIGISWSIIVAAGVYAFYLSKNDIISKRVEHMKIRERMYTNIIDTNEASKE